MLEHDPSVDEIGRGEDVEEAAAVGRQCAEAGLGGLGAVGVVLG